VSVESLAGIFRDLEAQGAHNINLVTPTHFVHQILAALDLYRPAVPLVYNCGGYESIETLGMLEGKVDIYLPDMKYDDPALAARYSSAPDYVEVNRAAVAEMCRQTGPARYDDQGLMLGGTLVRHLVLPGMAAQSMRVLNWIAEHLPQGTAVSLMAQYTPYGQALDDPLLKRPVTRREYDWVKAHLRALGLTEGFVQRREAQSAAFIPPFDGTGVPADDSAAPAPQHSR
jgi:putative pyruvate formate lyase activating enzyme